MIVDTLSRPPCTGENQHDCGVCIIVIDLSLDGAAKLREEQLSDPEVKKIINAFEANGDLNIANWTSQRYTMSNDVPIYADRRQIHRLKNLKAEDC